MTLAAEIARKVSAAGFFPVGMISADGREVRSSFAHSKNPLQVILVGSLGSGFWAVFKTSAEAADGLPDAMDRFTRRVLGGIADDLGVEVLFPFDGPSYFPFQRWAKACGGFSQSPLGVLAHEIYGPWLGLRGAFLVPEAAKITPDNNAEGPCPACSDKPCVSVCPVGAISLDRGYEYIVCRAYLTENPSAECWQGCLARRACPFGQEHAHSSDQARFHMTSFAG